MNADAQKNTGFFMSYIVRVLRFCAHQLPMHVSTVFRTRGPCTHILSTSDCRVLNVASHDTLISTRLDALHSLLKHVPGPNQQSRRINSLASS